MRKRVLALFALLAPLFLLGRGASAARAEGFDHSRWDRVLKKLVTETSRVDYAALKADHTDLDAYVAQLAARSPFSHLGDFSTRESQLAYWINAYNAFVFKGVVENWPTKSVRNLGKLYSFFWHRKFTAGGKEYTLNGIEDILRHKLNEPRIHFAIVCASNSCPRLQHEAYTAENCDRLLEEAARSFLNEPRNLKIDAARNRVTLARIFSLYHEDFENYVRAHNAAHTGNLRLDYVLLYANEANRAVIGTLNKPRVDHFSYDWGINDVHAPESTQEFVEKEKKE